MSGEWANEGGVGKWAGSGQMNGEWANEQQVGKWASEWIMSSTYVSYREWHSNIFSEIETMIKMHSINIKLITEQIFCLVNMSFITKFVIFNLKQHTQFSLAKGSVEARESSDFRWHCFIQLKFLDATTHLYKRSCPSVCPSVCPSRVIFERRIWPFLRVKIHHMMS